MFSKSLIGFFIGFYLKPAFCQCQAELYTNPVINSNHPDPGVLRLEDGKGFVAVSTSDHARADEGDPVFPIIFSMDLVHWEEMGYVFPEGYFPRWAYIDTWAPEIHRVNNSYYVYYSARKRSDDQCGIGVAISKSSPFGPYEDLGRPIIETNPGVIDIHHFKDPKDNMPYLIWKIDYNSITMPSKIFMRRVETDGITFNPDWPIYTLMRALSIDDYLVTEGPCLIYRQGYYYLFFSGNGFLSPYYHVSVARSKTATGPFERRDWDYFLHTDLTRFDAGRNSTFVGPGGGTAVKVNDRDDDDSWWYVYHTWRYNQVGHDPPGRVLNADKMTWEDGWPHIGTPSDTPTPVPIV